MTAPLSTDEATVLLTSILMDPQWSVDSIADLPKDDPFGKLCYNLAEIRAHVQALSKGDLSRGSKARGFVAGSLKATEANLRHLTWQMERVAQGDYSQSVSFMGDFSKAFNKMSREMHSKAEELSRLLERYRMSTDEDRAPQPAYILQIGHERTPPRKGILSGFPFGALPRPCRSRQL